jgi:tetratricopeptide (TPR) repeat protein
MDATELGLQTNAVLANRYLIRKELGVGGMGRVYLADDQKLALPVAVKVLRDVLRQDPGSVNRLIGEAKASIMLAHPNIVRLHNFEDGETAKFLVMEYVEGETLAHLIAREGKLPESEVRRIAIEICKGLEHAHSKKVIHRDMKPGNVLLGKDGSIKVADFGIARLCRDSMSRLTSQQDSGTLMYMAPEQLDGESGELTDLYSLGVVLYEMLTGDPPFVTGEITAQIRYKAPREIPGISPDMSRIVFKCLEKKPENRFASVRALREELDGTGAQSRAKEAELERLTVAAQHALDEGKHADAASSAERILQLRPGDPAAAQILERAGQLRKEAETKDAVGRREEEEEAERKKQQEAARRARAEDSKAKGREAFDAGRYGDAIGQWEEALALDPEDAALKASLAEARQKAELVKKQYEWKKWADAALAQANDLMRQGRHGDAEGVLEQCLQHDPHNAAFAGLLAQVRALAIQGAPKAPKRPKSRKRVAVYIIAAAVLLVLVGVIVQLNDSGSNTSYVPPAATESQTEKPSVPASPQPAPEPAPARVTDIRGQWSYIAVAPNGFSVKGQLLVTGDASRPHLVAATAYSMVGTDGFVHQYRERSDLDGTFDGTNLMAQCFSKSVLMDGVAVMPVGLPARLNMTLSPDGLLMRGQSVNSMGVVIMVSAQR